MPNRRYRAIYVSQATAPTAAEAVAAADVIAQAAEKANTRLDVTGLLLTHERWYLQALEGRRATLSDLLFRIARDSRHARFQLICFEPADAPRFGAWGMIHARYSHTVQDMIDAEALGASFDPEMADPDQLLRILTQAAQRFAQAA